MSYIIENANVVSEQGFKTTSFLIRQNRISAVQASFARLKHMRMNANNFVMAPTFVVFDEQIYNDKSFQENKKHYIEQFIQKGCTTILTTADIQYENEFAAKMKRKKASLITSPIDYFIAVKIPIRKLTPSFIRKCKKEKVPAIFVRIENPFELTSVPWGWLREALFPYNCPLVPVFSVKTEKEKQQANHIWRKITTNEKIPSIKKELQVNEPISKPYLAKMGIYPLKSNLLQGGEVSYNFYYNDFEGVPVEESELFHYHKLRLAVTMHKGCVIRAGEKVLFRSGFGEHVMINKPSFYSQ